VSNEYNCAAGRGLRNLRRGPLKEADDRLLPRTYRRVCPVPVCVTLLQVSAVGCLRGTFDGGCILCGVMFWR
jgi:hypothetical protein